MFIWEEERKIREPTDQKKNTGSQTSVLIQLEKDWKWLSHVRAKRANFLKNNLYLYWHKKQQQ